MCRRRRSLFLSVALFFSCSLLAFSQAQDFADVPPFDTTRMYKVLGATLEQLRVDYQELIMQLEISEKAFGEYKTANKAEAEAYHAKIAELEKLIALLQAEIILWQIGAGVAVAAAIGLGVAWMLK